MSNKVRPYGDFIPAEHEKLVSDLTPPPGTTVETKMQNDKYAFIMNGYLLCVSTYLSQISIPQILEKQLERRDIDTVCGYELY